MIKIEALTLEEAYTKASQQLDCSITELNFEVIQQPKKGFLGMWKKSAIIVATCKNIPKKVNNTPKPLNSEKKTFIPKYDKSLQNNKKNSRPKEPLQRDRDKKIKSSTQSDIFDNFYSHESSKSKQTKVKNSTKDIQKAKKIQKQKNNNCIITDQLINDIEKDIKELFSFTCYKISDISLSKYSENTLLVEINGDDAALLIGKDGYRYKAISYMLFNWINPKYGISLRLEIAEFLKNQEDMIYRYIDTLSEKIEKVGRTQTKPLDGILIHIALNRLRDLYPNKYVGIKSKDDRRFIVINDFN